MVKLLLRETAEVDLLRRMKVLDPSSIGSHLIRMPLPGSKMLINTGRMCYLSRCEIKVAIVSITVPLKERPLK